jgi:hypothetical protein
MESPECAKAAKTRLSGDIMSFYIAQRNKETGKFTLWDKDGEPNEFRNEAKAIDAYVMAVQFEGMKNVLLLETTDVKVNVTVTPLHKEDEDQT